MAETIENIVRNLIIDEQPINPKYYEKMSQLLDALVEQRKKKTIDYKRYLEKIVELAKKVKNPTVGESYPKTLNTPATHTRTISTLIPATDGGKPHLATEWGGTEFNWIANRRAYITPEHSD